VARKFQLSQNVPSSETIERGQSNKNIQIPDNHGLERNGWIVNGRAYTGIISTT
jgi:hypothetical protein